MPEEPPVTLIWRFYEATGAIPTIEWHEGCVVHNLTCHEGVYIPPDSVAVTRRDTYSQSALAHELMHARLYELGIDDPNHEDHLWSLVPRANRKLEERGW